MKRHNLVRQRFLDELENWLTPSLMYHCFTGEDDPYQLARIDRLDPSLVDADAEPNPRSWQIS